MSGETSLFPVRVVAAMLVAGAVSFLAFLWLTAYAPDLRSGSDGGAHGLSNAATGYKGLADLIRATGGRVTYARGEPRSSDTGLLVLTPTPMTDPKLLAEMVNGRTSGRTLIILPKWQTKPLEIGRKGWVTGLGPSGTYAAARILSALVSTTATQRPPSPDRGQAVSRYVDTFRVPDQTQTIAGKGLEPIVASDTGGILAARVADRATSLYIVADPDLLDNLGLKDPATARAAIGLMDHMTEAADRSVTFDLTLHGFAGSSNLLRLAFEPPFLAATLCLLVAAALAGLNAFYPFGPAIREARAISFGKRALVANSADLLIGAGRERLAGRRYVQLIRDAAGARLGLPAGMDPADAAEHLDRLGTSEGRRFGDLAADAEAANGRTAIAAAAAALYRWKKERLA